MIEVPPDGEVVVAVTIPLDPTPKARPRLGARGGTYTAPTSARAEAAVKLLLKTGMRGGKAVTGAVAVDLAFRCKDHHRRDIDNLTKLVLDAGNRIVWADDAQVVELHARVTRGSAEPGTDILVRRVPSQVPA